MNIHLVEDDPVLARGLQINLELEGHKIFLNTGVSAALKTQESQSIQFIILDLGLAEGSGFDFLKKIRETNPTVPVIILSAQSDEDSIVKGLQLGANDFVRKPYSYKELAARMDVILRKPQVISKEYSFFDLTVSVDQRIVKYQDRIVDLNRKEFDIILYLVQHAEMIINRDSLMTALNNESDIFDRTIDSHISHIRKNFKTAQVTSVKISSVYGLGYRLEKA